MVPTSLVVLLAGLGLPGLPADVEQRIRSRAVLPDGYCQFGVYLNSDGSFTLGGETPGGPYTHRPLALRPSRSADTLPAVTALGKLAGWEVLHPWGTDAVLRLAAASAAVCKTNADEAMNLAGEFIPAPVIPAAGER